MRLRSGDKHHLRKPANRKAHQESSFRSPNWFQVYLLKLKFRCFSWIKVYVLISAKLQAKNVLISQWNSRLMFLIKFGTIFFGVRLYCNISTKSAATAAADLAEMLPPVAFVLARHYRRRFKSGCAALSFKKTSLRGIIFRNTPSNIGRLLKLSYSKIVRRITSVFRGQAGRS